MDKGFSPSGRQVALMRKIGRYLKGHPDESITLSQLSQRFGLPVTTLKRYFRAVYGMPVSDYLRQVRMQKAARLLRSTDQTVLWVAGQVGYLNGSKFAAAFKAATGFSPSGYRREEKVSWEIK